MDDSRKFYCWGFNTTSCHNVASAEGEFCTDCYKQLQQRHSKNICTACAGACTNKTTKGRFLCELCHMKFKKEFQEFQSASAAYTMHRKKCRRSYVCCLKCDPLYKRFVRTRDNLRIVQNILLPFVVGDCTP